MNRRRTAWLVILLVGILSAACGGNAPEPEVATMEADTPETATGGEETADTATAVPEATEAPTAPAESVNSFDGVIDAIVQIEAQGSFVDPEEGMLLNTAGRGSGFIVDESGIAVTNNHVVTGAAFLQVWVGGEGEPRNAKILGVSECSDLAVIDIDGEGFPALTWFEDAAALGTEVYAAGFPLGDPEPTLTRGIISKERASGETNWASVDEVIEHDATINPGNSGGPLVTADGRVIGVNYAGDAGTGQFYAIGHEQAQQIVAALRNGDDVNAIGINGTAILTGDGLSGIWVASVKSGSPADQAGIRGGDIITKMEGLVLATDGTMADYCDILRSRNPEDTISVEVLRFETQEVLEGQINGRALEPSFSFAQAVEEPGTQESSDGGDEAAATYTEYVGIYDDANSVYMEVPVEWVEVDGSPWVLDGEVIGASLLAAPNLQSFYDTYATPGVILFASTQLASPDLNEVLNSFDFTADCTYDSRSDYQDPIFTGLYDLYTDCDDVGSLLIVLAAEPEDGSYAVALVGLAVTSADLDALDRVLDTFNVVGTLPGS